MDWQIVLVLNIAIFATAQILIKLIVNRLPQKAQALSLQFLICAVLISLFNVATGNFQFFNNMCYVTPVGFVVAFGAYCQWRAIELSLSRTSLFLPLSYVLTLILATIFLSEIAEWNLKLAMGIILCFVAIFLFLKNRKKDEKEGNLKKWLIFTLGAILIFGTAVFLMKVFSSEVEIPRQQFLMYWYIGAFLGSLPILFLKKEKLFKFPGKIMFLVPLASLAIIGNLATQYWALELTLASRVVPFISVGATFLPVLIGWFLFKEKKRLSKREILAFSIGIAGALLIILS